MQNENAGKKVEQIANDKYPFLEPKKTDSEDWKMHCDSVNRKVMVQRVSFIDGYTQAQQSQPMWREIDRNEEYDYIFAKWKETDVHNIDWCVDGPWLINNGYTHYLSSDDLLRLPTEKK